MKLDHALPSQGALKATYQAPVLRLLGSVAELTAAGSPPNVEQGNPGNCSQNDAAPCRRP